MKILFMGQLRSPCGYSNAAKNYIRAIDKVISNDVDFKVYDKTLDKHKYSSDEFESIVSKYELDENSLRKYIKENRGEYIFIFHYPVHCYDELAKTIPRFNDIIKNSKCHIAMTLWEADHVMNSWIQTAKNFNVQMTAAACTWNQQMFERDFQLPSLYIPCVITAVQHTNDTQYYCADPDTTFKILSVSQFSYRKGFDILLRAYFMEFGLQDDVILVLKTYGIAGPESHSAIIEEISSYKKRIVCEKDKTYMFPTAKIALVLEHLDDVQMNQLYNSCDLYALLPRGEGFGLPFSEAMIYSKPIMCPNQGGHVDFIDSQNAYLVDCQYVPAFDGSFVTPTFMTHYYHKDMNWFESDVSSARKQLRQAYDDWKAGKLVAKGIAARSKLDPFSLENVGQQFLSECRRALTLIKK